MDRLEPVLARAQIDRRLWRSSPKVRPLLAAVAARGAATGLLVALQAGLLAHVVNAAYLEGAPFRALAAPLVALAAVVALRAAFEAGSRTASAALAAAVQSDLRTRALRRILAAGPLALGETRTGELVEVLTAGVASIGAFLARYLPQLALTVAVPTVVLLRVALADPLSALVLLVTLPLVPLFLALTGRMSERAARRRLQQLGRLAAHFLDVLSGLETLRLLGRSLAQERGIARASDDLRRETMAVLRVAFLSAFVLEFLSSLGLALVAVSVGLRLVAGRIGFEPAFLVLVLAPDFYAPWRALGARFHEAMNGVAAASRIFDLLDSAPAPAAGGAGAQRLPGRGPWPVELRAVRFRHAGRAQDTLAGVEALLRPGERAALLGPSGSGKSTLLALLSGFAPPAGGEIRVGGVALPKLDPAWWRAQVTLVPQRPHLFPGSVAENLRLARPGAAERELREAARRARALEFIEALPDGWETRLGAGGRRLSGGELQRLSLARAFLRDTPYVWLDEPTAHLDLASEEAVLEALAELLRGRSAVLVAHRRAVLRVVDTVWVLGEGRIARSGPASAFAGPGSSGPAAGPGRGTGGERDEGRARRALAAR